MDKPEQVAGNLARNLAALRHVRGLTQEALAKAAAVPRSTITNLESGEGNPSLTVLIKVAGALGVPIDELLASARTKVRKWVEGDLSVRNRGKGVRLRSLVPEPVPDSVLEVMEFEPEGNLRGTPHLPGTREYFTCLRGQVTIFVTGEQYDLGTGDVLAFPGNVPHFYRNPNTQREATGISVVILAKAGG